MISLPGFRAEATIYRSSVIYQGVWAAAAAARSGVDPQLGPRLGTGGGGDDGGGVCSPGCLPPCDGDINSPTGCSQECIAKNCNHFQQSCRGCANPCPGGQFCNRVCKDTSSDRNNCGGCGNVCPPGVPCRSGVCGCLPGQTLCNGVCRSLSGDPQNCGACGHACGAGQVCQDGNCVAGNCRVFCSTWNSCNQTCGSWPPGFSNAQCWLDCLQSSVDCLNSTCG